MSRLVASQRAWLAPSWVREDLSRKAQALPSLDLRFAESKSLTDAASGSNLVTFTRASSGTYVDSQGVLRTATTNLLLRSEQFDNASWIKTNTTVTADQAVAPNGLTSADLIAGNTGTATKYIYGLYSASTSGVFTFSVFAKAGTESFIVVRITDQGGVNEVRQRFDLSSGTLNGSVAVGGTATAGSSSVSAVGNGWYRCTVTATFAAFTQLQGNVWLNNYASTSLTTNFYLWGAQLEQSSTVGEYIPTTSTINSAPRFDHNPTTGESLGLLVEEQRTNLVLRSEEFDDASYVKTNSTVNANAFLAPNGSITADKVVETSATGVHAVNTPSFSVTSGLAYTYSVYVKSAERTWCYLQFSSAPFGGTTAASFDVGVGALGTQTNCTAAITRLQGGWFRCSITATPITSDASVVVANYLATGNTLTSYAGNSTSGIYIWGAQLEAGSFPTSYIPTTTATATRSADVASITGANFSSWYSQSEGTVFAEFNGTNITSGQFPRIFEFNDGTSNNFIRVQQYAANSVRASVTTATVGQFAADNGSVAVGVRGKAVFASAFNDAALATNGASPTVDTAYLVPTGLTQIGIGGQSYVSTNVFNSTIRRLVYWGQRLPNSVLQTITQ